MAEYLIQGETLTATADKIRECSVVVGHLTHVINPKFIENQTTQRLLTDDIIVYYWEDITTSGYASGGLNYGSGYRGGVVVYYYQENYDGNTVPTLFLEENDGIFTEPYFYVGLDQVDGVTYDKWRLIELTDGDGNQPNSSENYTWDSSMRKYIYTTRITMSVNEADELISPIDFPERIGNIYNTGYAEGRSDAVEEGEVATIEYDDTTKTLTITAL